MVGIDRELVEAHLVDLLLAFLLRLPVVERVVVARLVEELVDIDAGDVLLAVARDVVPVAPDLEGDLAAVLLPLGLDDRVADQMAEVAAGDEFLAVHADDHVARQEFALGGRALEGGLHLDLVALEPRRP